MHESPTTGDRTHFAFGLTVADVEDFREILRAECGEELTLVEAWARATEVLALFAVFLEQLRIAPTPGQSSSVEGLDRIPGSPN